MKLVSLWRRRRRRRRDLYFVCEEKVDTCLLSRLSISQYVHRGPTTIYWPIALFGIKSIQICCAPRAPLAFRSPRHPKANLIQKNIMRTCQVYFRPPYWPAVGWSSRDRFYLLCIINRATFTFKSFIYPSPALAGQQTWLFLHFDTLAQFNRWHKSPHVIDRKSINLSRRWPFWFYSPSRRIPIFRHFLNRQYWHWFLWCWSIGQLRLPRHEYVRLRRTDRLKNDLQPVKRWKMSD